MSVYTCLFWLETFGKQSNDEEKNIVKLRRKAYKTYKHINMRSQNNHDNECLNRFILVGYV